jgi:subtilisin family serine protease
MNLRTKLLRGAIAFTIVASGITPVHAGDGSIRRAVRPAKDQYLVKLSDSLSPSEARSIANILANQHRGKLLHVWDSVVPSFAIEAPEAAAQAISRHPLVDFVEEDAEWTISQVQSSAPWHLDRIDQRFLPLDGYYKQGCISTDVFAYVLDTGVRASHREFWTNSVNPVSRVLPGVNINYSGTVGSATGTETNPCSGVTYYDDYTNPCSRNDKECLGGGHGTAVASVLGGLTYGVAKSVKIIPVRTHDCLGSSYSSLIVQGLQWIYNDKPTRSGPAVLNISSGSYEAPGTPETLAETWIKKLINERNITVVVAANNQEIDASNTSPARVPEVITVGGSTNADRRWHCNSSNPWETCFDDPNSAVNDNLGSNYGSVIDIFAPAQNISSASIKEREDPNNPASRCCRDSDTAQRQGQRSGTSFAAPAVAGVAARLLIGSGASLTPAQVWQQILTNASGSYPSTEPPVMREKEGDPNAGPLFSINRLLYQAGVTRCRVVGP